MLPLISIIIPVYNGEKFLTNAIYNIQNQNYQPLEIIIVDDGSTDSTASTAAQYHDQIHYIYQSNQGAAAARNRGIQAAKGEVYAFLDVDDEWVEGGLERMISNLMANPNAEIVRGLIKYQTIGENHTKPALNQMISHAVADSPIHAVNLGSAVFRRSVFEKVGLFDPSLKINEDSEWFMRAWQKQAVKIDLDQVFLIYRRHGSNTTQDQNLVRSSMLHIFKRHLDRRRSNPQQQDQSKESFPSLTKYLLNQSL